MTDSLIQTEIRSIIDRLRWQESRDGMICHATRYDAMRAALSLLNRVSVPSRFAVTRSRLFRVMNEAKINLVTM